MEEGSSKATEWSEAHHLSCLGYKTPFQSFTTVGISVECLNTTCCDFVMT